MLGSDVVWEPVLLGAMFAARGSGSWSLTDERAWGIAEVERRAAAYGLPPSALARAVAGEHAAGDAGAMAAAEAGVGRAFLLAGLRLGFVHGRDLSEPAAVADAASTAGIEGEALLAAASSPSVKAALRERTDAAIALGVQRRSEVVVGEQAFWGDDRLEDAARALRI